LTQYEVDLDVFQGPLDLLLRLIEREELDITTVSLAVVTDQFLAYLATVRERSAARLADFLLVAGRLLVLKSRVLLPRPDTADDTDEDTVIEDDLVHQLREYKRYKEAAARLREIEERGLRAYPRAAPRPHLEPRLVPGEVSVRELMLAFRKVLETRPPLQPVDGVVAPITVHIGKCITRILDHVAQSPRARFSALLQASRSRLEVIVTFLALLELIKQQRLRVTQEHPFGEIYLQSREPDPDLVIVPEEATTYEGEAEGAEAVVGPAVADVEAVLTESVQTAAIGTAEA
jgi:segregation and condensation protein A